MPPALSLSSSSSMSRSGADARVSAPLNTALVVVEKSCLSDQVLRMVKATFQVCVCVVLELIYVCIYASVCRCLSDVLRHFPGVYVVLELICMCVRECECV